MTSAAAPEPELDDRLERFAELRRTGDERLRDQLVGQHLTLARHMASRFANRGVPFEDLFQVASVGLLHAVDRFDPEIGTSFGAFAAPTILGEIKRHFRDRAWDLRVPRRLQELHLELHAIIGTLTQQLGRAPTIGELAAATRASEEEVIEAVEAGRAYNARSIDHDSSSGPQAEIDRALRHVDTALDRAEERLLVAHLLESLAPRERLIMRLRYWGRLSQAEIAQRLGISQMHVSRLLARSLAHFQEQLGENPFGC